MGSVLSEEDSRLLASLMGVGQSALEFVENAGRLAKDPAASGLEVVI